METSPLGLGWATAEIDPVERRRRLLLDASDELLDEVERLRLADRRLVPPPLREAIETLQVRLGRPQPAVNPGTLEGAHDLVLAVQARLMAANPRRPTPRTHANRGAGQPLVARISGGGRWKLLAMPSLPSQAPDAGWEELVLATVERAWDRWAYARHHANAAAREQRPADLALAAVEAAWQNYWELCQEAQRLLVSTSGRR